MTGGAAGREPGAEVGRGLATPALVLAADHRARGVITIERYADYIDAVGGGAAPLRRHSGHGPAAR